MHLKLYDSMNLTVHHRGNRNPLNKKHEVLALTSSSCSFSSENLNLAGNVSNGTNIPLRSVSIPNQTQYRGPLHCVSSILQSEGLQGLYRGAGAMVLRDVPGYTLYFIPYTIFCNLLKPDATSSPHPCSIWLAGGLAGKYSLFCDHWSRV